MKLQINKLVNNIGQIDGVPANPRQINKDDYAKLVKSLQDDPEFLEHKPLHVYAAGDKYVVLGGNQRLRALKELKYKEVPVTIYKPETPPDVLKARIIKDNSEFGSYDMDLLANEWSDMPLDDWGVNLPDDFLGEPEIEEDEAPEVSSDPPVSVLGEVYQLGRHRLMAGSATEAGDVELLMNGDKADMVFTDPPYGMNLDTDYSKRPLTRAASNKHKGQNSYSPVIGDNEDYDPSHIFKDFGYCKEIFLWGADYYSKRLPDGGSWLVWDKKKGVEDVNYTSAEFEICWSMKKTAKKIVRVTWFGLLGTEKQDVRNRIHPTQKPLELNEWFILKYSKAEDIVVDVFGGSGSTLIACEQTNRICYMMELDPKYIDVIRKRYHKFVTGDDEGWQDGTPVIGV